MKLALVALAASLCGIFLGIYLGLEITTKTLKDSNYLISPAFNQPPKLNAAIQELLEEHGSVEIGLPHYVVFIKGKPELLLSSNGVKTNISEEISNQLLTSKGYSESSSGSNSSDNVLDWVISRNPVINSPAAPDEYNICATWPSAPGCPCPVSQVPPAEKTSCTKAAWKGTGDTGSSGSHCHCTQY